MTEKLCDKQDFIRLIYIFIATKLYEKMEYVIFHIYLKNLYV